VAHKPPFVIYFTLGVMTQVPRLCLKLGVAYVVACIPSTVLLGTIGPHGPMVSWPMAVAYGLIFPWQDLALSLVLFWPVLVIGLAVIWWTERARSQTTLPAERDV